MLPEKIKKFAAKTGMPISIEMFGSAIDREFGGCYMTDYEMLRVDFDYAVLGIFKDGKMIPISETMKLCKKFGLKMPMEQFRAYPERGLAHQTQEFIDTYGLFFKRGAIKFRDVFDLYKRLEEIYGEMNRSYWIRGGKKDRIIIEGSVWRIATPKGEAVYKNKTPTERAGKIRELSIASMRTYLRRCLEDLPVSEFFNRGKCLAELKAHLKEDCDPKTVEINEDILKGEYERYCGVLGSYILFHT